MGHGSISSAKTAELSLHLAGGTATDARRLRRVLGSPRRWWRLSADAWRRAGLTPRLTSALADERRREGARSARARARALGVRLVHHHEVGYPPALREVTRAPLCLWVAGRWPPPPEAVALVGARAATPYGRSTAHGLGGLAAEHGVAVVSGLARGIDRWALEGCLEAGGWPVAVVGSGIDVPYPREHATLQAEVARVGTVLAEVPPGSPPRAHHFPSRNRVIAALARLVVVVEADLRSGSLITARHALELGREVAAVPGRIDVPQSRGTLRLLADGAHLVTDLDGWGETLRDLVAGPACEPPRARDGPLARRVLSRLHEGGRSVAELSRALGTGEEALRPVLFTLQLEGRVRPEGDERYALRA